MMLRQVIIVLLSLAWTLPWPEGGSVSENFRFASSLPTSRLGPSHSRGHGRPRFSETLPPSGQEARFKGEIIGDAANGYARFVLTDKGEIGWSKDGKTWNVVDFNETYLGYYEPVRLVGIAAGKADAAVVGIYEKTGAPAMFVSSRGNVWTERRLIYQQGEEYFELTETPLSVRADTGRDEYVLTCTDGVLFFVPPCSHCNRMEYHGDD